MAVRWVVGVGVGYVQVGVRCGVQTVFKWPVRFAASISSMAERSCFRTMSRGFFSCISAYVSVNVGGRLLGMGGWMSTAVIRGEWQGAGNVGRVDDDGRHVAEV